MPVITPDVPAVETAIVAMTNAFRLENKLGEVRPNAQLAQAARAYAAYLARTNAFSHTADGRQPADRVGETGYQYCQVAENLALNLDSRGFETWALAAHAVEGWKNSPGHRRNMLTPHVTDIGVAVAQAPGSSAPKYISVQLFGRPRSLGYQFAVRNEAAESVTYSFGGKTHQASPRMTITHSACQPGEVAFERLGSLLFGKSVSARYEAQDGVVYRVAGDSTAGIKVEIAPRAKGK
jgi:hypothetical protein